MLGILFSTANFKTQIVPPPKKRILFCLGWASSCEVCGFKHSIHGGVEGKHVKVIRV